MDTVSSDVIEAWKDENSFKRLELYFPDLNLYIRNDQVEQDSFTLTEKLLSGSDLEFVGCISSCMEVTIYDDDHKLKGQEVRVQIAADDTDPEPLFVGYIDSIKTELETTKKQLTAYDAIYTKMSDKNVASWYNGLEFPIKMKDVRDSLFNVIGVFQQPTYMISDEIEIEKQYKKLENLNALDVVKCICQLNGMFGRMNRYGEFEYIAVNSFTTTGLFPGIGTYPGSETWPSVGGGGDDTYFGYYEKMYFDDFVVNPIEKVIIRDSSSEAGWSSSHIIAVDFDGNESVDPNEIQNDGGGVTEPNVYIVEGNIFAKGLKDVTIVNLAKDILSIVENAPYTPFTATVPSTPYLDVGDSISMLVHDARAGSTTIKNFIMFNRTIKGVQNIKDEIVAEGVENQRLFVSNVNARLQELTDDSIDERLNELEEKIDNIKEGFCIKSVKEPPTDPDGKTLYLIQGECFTIYE